MGSLFKNATDYFLDLYSRAKGAQSDQPAPAGQTVPDPKPKPKPADKSSNGWVSGVDVSHHNGTVDWHGLKKAGVEFAFLKVTEGTGFVDSMFLKNVKGAKDAGILLGAYHFFHFSDSPGIQSGHFLKHVEGVELDLPHVLDWEQRGGNKSQKATAAIWLKNVEDASKKTPIIYADTGMIKELDLTENFARFPLWLANYSKPRLAGPWKDWTFWQDSETASFPGVKGHFDSNWFKGSLDELKAFAMKKTPDDIVGT